MSAKLVDARKVLRKGDRGQDVVGLQDLLNSHRGITPDLRPDGIFGPNTESAVRHFQKSRQLREDGIVGPMTWAKLAESPEGRRLHIEVVDATDITGIITLMMATESHNVLTMASVREMVDKVLATVQAYGGGRSIQLLTIIGHGAPGMQGLGMGRGWLDTPAGKFISSSHFAFTIEELRSIAAQGGSAAKAAREFLDLLNTLGRLKPFFRTDGVVELKGCRVAKGAEGERLLRGLSRLWGGVKVVGGEFYQFAITSSFVGTVLECSPIQCTKR